MNTNIELLIQPYSVQDNRSLIHLLVKELSCNKWTCFRAAVAFARTSGNYDAALQAMLQFARNGGRIDLTFGADRFSGESGSDYEAIKDLMDALGKEPNVRLFLYHEPGRTFHPKIYLFANEDEGCALLVIGSSNWSAGGFWKNIEVNVIIHLDLREEEHNRCYKEIQDCFEHYWTENEK